VISWADFQENSQVSNVMIMRPVGIELFHADRQIDGHKYMIKLTVAFRNPADAPKMICNTCNNNIICIFEFIIKVVTFPCLGSRQLSRDPINKVFLVTGKISVLFFGL